jgi:acetyltransferase-like isoleucine patch superfamily enzyme
MTIQEIADELGFTKIGKRWYSEMYLHVLDCTPYEIGAEVYISDGVYIQESGLTDKQLRQEYKEATDD